MYRIEKLKQAYPQIPWRSQLQLLGLFLAGIVFFAFVAGFYLNLSARSAAVGRDIQGIQQQIKIKAQENETLKTTLAELTSSKNLEERSEAMDFIAVQPEEALYVFVPGYGGRPSIAMAPPQEEPIVRAPVIPEEYTESIFRWLMRQIGPFLEPLFEEKQ